MTGISSSKQDDRGTEGGIASRLGGTFIEAYKQILKK